MKSFSSLRTVQLSEDKQRLRLLDQRQLPEEERWLELNELEDIAMAIETLAVRGAPAIGCAASLGLAVLSHSFPDDSIGFHREAQRSIERLHRTRPTAVNLFVALEEQQEVLRRHTGEDNSDVIRTALFASAMAHLEKDLQSCHSIGKYGMQFMPDKGKVITVSSVALNDAIAPPQ